MKKFFKEIYSLAFIALAVFAFKSTFICNYTVPTGSMMPLVEPWDKVVVNKMAFDIRIPFTKIRLFEYGTPQRGDVIVFECPYDSSLTFLKRLIGLPGDKIEVDHGFISVNGKPLDISEKDKKVLAQLLTDGGFYQETLNGKTYQVRRVPSYFGLPKVSVTVPEGEYFAMGDNRDESDDSRRWGFVPRENIWGKANFVYFSLEWLSWTEFPRINWSRIGTVLQS